VFVEARLPPILFDNPALLEQNWTAPPKGWLFGTWDVTYSSVISYSFLYNFQYFGAAYSEATIPGQNLDLTSFQISPTDSHVYTAYGIDTPHYRGNSDCGAECAYVYDFRGPNIDAANTWNLLAWGVDTRGDEYHVVYETQSYDRNGEPLPGNTPGIDVICRNGEGPSQETLAGIFSALTGLGNANITSIVERIKRMKYDGRRKAEPQIVCGLSCLNNTNLPRM
jgi:hypothetical protein